MHPSQYMIIWRGKETRNASSFKKLKLFSFIGHTWASKASKSKFPFNPFAIANFGTIFGKRTQKRKNETCICEKRICDMSPIKKKVYNKMGILHL